MLNRKIKGKRFLLPRSYGANSAGIVGNVAKKISIFDGKVIYTRDTHQEGYLSTQEGRNLPVVHCIEGSEGWDI